MGVRPLGLPTPPTLPSYASKESLGVSKIIPSNGNCFHDKIAVYAQTEKVHLRLTLTRTKCAPLRTSFPSMRKNLVRFLTRKKCLLLILFRFELCAIFYTYSCCLFKVRSNLKNNFQSELHVFFVCFLGESATNEVS